MTQASTGLGVGMVGHAFMGAAHSQAWRTAGRFFDLPLSPDMAVLCGRDAATAQAAADRLGWRHVVTDWKELLTRDDVALVDVCAPGDVHAEIAVAALDAGVHAIGKKIVEEAAEVWMAAEFQSDEQTAEEISQLVYHLQVLMVEKGMTPADVWRHL